jgi:uncharacterized protein YdaU (DUF1376 family)
MNYYEHHIGDYTVATTHLSFIEDATYSRLLRRYYSTEKPLPADVKVIQKLIGAISGIEKKAVVNILNEFFVLAADGWRQQRCDHEIKRFQDKQSKAKRNAESRWQAPGEAELPSEEGLHSGNFRDADAMLEKCGRNANAMLEKCERNAHQSPDTNHQSPDSIPQKPINQTDVGKTKRVSNGQQGAKAKPQVLEAIPTLRVVRDDPADPRLGEEAAREDLALQTRFAALVSKEGGAVAISDVRIRDMVKTGATEEELIKAISIARETRKKASVNTPINAGYVLAILKTVLLKRHTPDPGELTWWKSHSGIDAKGRELGMQAQGSESYECFKARIFTELRKRKEAGAMADAKEPTPSVNSDGNADGNLDIPADTALTAEETCHAN